MADTLDRISLTLPPEMVDRLDEIVDDWEYASRSGAVRDALRELFAVYEWESDPESGFYGTVVVFHEHDHDSDVAGELQAVQHEFADAVLAVQHLHLSHHQCMETIAVEGSGTEIRELSNRLRSIAGVQRVTFVIGESTDDVEQ